MKGSASQTKKLNIPALHQDAVKQLSGSPTEWGILVDIFLSLFIAINMCVIFAALYGPKTRGPFMEPPIKRESRPRSFYDADSSAGYPTEIVPNIIHVIRYNATNLTITDVVFLRSMYLNQRPRTIIVHCSPCGFTGPFVNWTEGINFTFVPLESPREVFERRNNNPTNGSLADIVKQYGGIYLSRDVFVVQSLSRYMRYEATLSVPPREYMGSSVMIFHGDARFLKLYREISIQYDDASWLLTAGHLPTITLLRQHPHLFNLRVEGLEVNLDMLNALYTPLSYHNWRNAYVIHAHLNLRHLNTDDPLRNIDFTEENIRKVDNTFGQMARSVLFGTSNIVGSDVPVLSVHKLTA